MSILSNFIELNNFAYNISDHYKITFNYINILFEL